MLGQFISNILTFYREAFAGEIVNDRLNPLHLAIATSGYRIQSRTLQIPDRFGIFSPGPPRLQTHEGLCFIVLVCWFCLYLTTSAFLFFLCRLKGRPTGLKFGAVLSLGLVVELALIWIAAVHNRRRAPGHEWEDWKLRQD